MVGDNSQGLRYLITKHIKPLALSELCELFFFYEKCWIQAAELSSGPPYPPILFLNVDRHNILRTNMVVILIAFSIGSRGDKEI